MAGKKAHGLVILVMSGTGYVGQRLVPRLLAAGHAIRALVRDPRRTQTLLPLPLTPFETAVRKAFADARPGRPAAPLLTDQRGQLTTAPPAAVFGELTRIGGPNGWYYLDWLWRLRGAADVLLGGPGLDRRTPLPASLAAGDHRDFWQVLEVQPNRRLRLRARMRVPGEAELEWTIAPRDGGSLLCQAARFQPNGLAGYAYWYGLLPVHLLIFRGLVPAIAGRAEQQTHQRAVCHGRRSRSAAVFDDSAPDWRP